MDKKNREVVVAILDIIGAYVATHPHAVADAQRVILLYTAQACEGAARIIGGVGLRARAAYERTNA